MDEETDSDGTAGSKGDCPPLSEQGLINYK